MKATQVEKLAWAVPAKASMAAAALLGVFSAAGHAAQNSGAFSVAINLQRGAALLNTGIAAPTGNTTAAGLCRSGAGIGVFGATMTVVCATGAIVDFQGDSSRLPWTSGQDSSYRFMLNVYREGEYLGTVDSYMGIGTVTSWRMVKLHNRDYLEMMVHW